MDGIRRCCANCRQPFGADARNAWHQQYCAAPACRAASKAASQRRWLAKPENRDYFRGPEHVQRVQLWRQAHPGYARHGQSGAANSTAKPSQAVSTAAAAPLQDLVPAEVVAAQEDFRTAAAAAAAACEASLPAPLQDLLQQQPVVLIGLLAHLSASTLQDDIALAGRRLLQLGHDVLGGVRT